MLVLAGHHVLVAGNAARHQSVLAVFHYQDRLEDGIFKCSGGCQE